MAGPESGLEVPARAEPSLLEDILPFRHLFLQEVNAQVRYDACHSRGWTDSYLLYVGERAVGYGSIKGKDELSDRDAVFEFFVIPPFRNCLEALFECLLDASGAKYIECQTNDPLLPLVIHRFATDVESKVVLFADETVTAHQISGVEFRRRRRTDSIGVEHGEFVLDQGGEVAATGGFLLHYNAPFADVYMAVPEAHRRKGFATLLIQEVKRECYLAGRVPAARCNIDNEGSKASLLKAGFKVAGFMLTGDVRGA